MEIQALGFVFSYLVYFCGVFMALELHKVSTDYNNVSMQGHKEMCTPCFSITMPDSLDDNTVGESTKKLVKYTKEQVYRLRLRFSMLGIDKNICKWISELGIKHRFRGRRGRGICKAQLVKNWDNSLGIHNKVLRTLQRVDNEKVKWEQCVKMGLANVRSVKKKTEEIIHNIVEEELDLSFICETWIDNDDSVTKAKLKTELLSFKVNKQKSGKGGGVG